MSKFKDGRLIFAYSTAMLLELFLLVLLIFGVILFVLNYVVT